MLTTNYQVLTTNYITNNNLRKLDYFKVIE